MPHPECAPIQPGDRATASDLALVVDAGRKGVRGVYHGVEVRDREGGRVRARGLPDHCELAAAGTLHPDDDTAVVDVVRRPGAAGERPEREELAGHASWLVRSP